MSSDPSSSSASASRQALVVGSGAVGIACAHFLAEAGFETTVIERDKIAGGCSHGNCGYVSPSHVLPLTEPGAISMALKSIFKRSAPFRVKPRFSPALWHWLWQFARRCDHQQMLTVGKHLQAILDSSIIEYRRLAAEGVFNGQWKECGLLYVLRSEQGVASMAKTDRLVTEHFGVPAQHIPAKDLLDFEPSLKPGLAGGFYYPQDAMVKPDELTAQWARQLQSRGVAFIEQCEFKRLKREQGCVVGVHTSQGELPADVVVFATGAWSSQLADALGCRLPVQPGKGYSVTTRRPERCPTYPMIFPEHKVAVSPFEDRWRIGSMMEFAGFDTTIPQQRIEQLRASAAVYLTTATTHEDEEIWYGWRPMTWDSLPIIGPVPGNKQTFLACGHNMVGMSMAAATGKLIAEMALGRPTHIDASAFSPNRF